MTDEERAAKNAAGNADGCLTCPVCGDSMRWKQFHETTFFVGTITPVFAGAPHAGEKAIVVLCVDCWPKLTPEQRLPYYESRTAVWEQDVKPPRPNDEADARRYDAQIGLVQIDRSAVKHAVLAGK